jgi:hypothetical protein
MRIRDRSNCLTDRQSEVMTRRQYCVPRCPIRDQDGIPRRRFALHLKCGEIEPILKEKGEELRAEKLF